MREARPLRFRGLERTRLAWLENTVNPGKPGDQGRLRTLLSLADQARQEEDPDLALSILAGAAFTCFWADHDEQLRQLIVGAATQVPVPGDDPRLLAALALADPVGQGAVVIDRVRRLEPGPDIEAGGLHLAGIAATIAGDFENGAAFLAAAVARLRAQGRLGLLAQALVAQAWTAIQLIDWNVAIPAAEEGTRLARETAQPMFVATGESAVALLAALRGDEDTASSLNAKVERELAPAGVSAVLAMVQLARGLAALGGARYAEAYAHLRRMFDPADIAYHHMQRCWGISELAEAAVHSDHRDEARAQMPELERAAGQNPVTVAARGLALRPGAAGRRLPRRGLVPGRPRHTNGSLAVLPGQNTARVRVLASPSAPHRRLPPSAAGRTRWIRRPRAHPMGEARPARTPRRG